MRLCDALGINLVLDEPRDVYLHGWGDKCADAKIVKCSWSVTTHDIKGLPTTLTFDLVDGESPLILGLDVKRYANTYNLSSPPYVEFRRPSDNRPRKILTYFGDGDSRLRLEIVPHQYSTSASLMANAHGRTDLSIAKKVHRFTHAHADEMKAL